MVLWPDMEAAFVGVVETPGQPARAVYSFERMVSVLMTRDGMSYEDAVEYLNFNTVGAYHGPATPAVLYELPKDMALQEYTAQWAEELPMAKPNKKNAPKCARCGFPRSMHNKKDNCPLGTHSMEGFEMFHPSKTYKEDNLCP